VLVTYANLFRAIPREIVGRGRVKLSVLQNVIEKELSLLQHFCCCMWDHLYENAEPTEESYL